MFDGDRVVGADGELTMLGVTKPVSLKVADFACGEQPVQQEADVRRRSDRDDQALGVGNDDRYPARARRRDPDHDPGRGVPGIGFAR